MQLSTDMRTELRTELRLREESSEPRDEFISIWLYDMMLVAVYAKEICFSICAFLIYFSEFC